MMKWNITDTEIEVVEKLLLPENCHFADDAKEVIRYWKSTDVSACPGSGKTTVLLAKLKLIADRMPLENGTGICVLSHTNVAVNEIKSKLAEYADKIISYPNFIGTIQSFIDKFITFPYLKSIINEPLQVVDDVAYAEHLYRLIISNKNKYGKLFYFIKMRCENSGSQYKDIFDYVKDLYLENDALYRKGEYKSLASSKSNSAIQYKKAKEELLLSHGILTYKDAYQYGMLALSQRKDMSSLLCKRFSYVFIDEFQDCSQMQREVLSCIFNKTKCCVFKIGDPDQAIYVGDRDNPKDWKPSENALHIASSNRYSQEIANVLSPLKSGKHDICSLRGEIGVTPTLIIYDDNTRNHVIDAFVFLLDKHKLTDPNGIYKAIGWIKNESAKGIKIGDYWKDYNATDKLQSENSYWGMIEVICEVLKQGKLYKAESVVRKLMCMIVNYLGCKDSDGHSFTYSSIKKTLDGKYHHIYREKVLVLTLLPKYEAAGVDSIIREIVNDIFGRDDIFERFPKYFMDESYKSKSKSLNNNICCFKRRKIQFSTVHKVKGETHDATLYLETETKGSSDLKRVLPYLKGTKPGTSPIYNYSRKCVYVGFSRPKKLLCVAMHENTYNQSGNVFSSWEIFDCRNWIASITM